MNKNISVQNQAYISRDAPRKNNKPNFQREIYSSSEKSNTGNWKTDSKSNTGI